MSWYGNRLPNFVEANKETELRKKLAEISMGIEEKLEVINIYPRGSKIVAWYFLDMHKANKVPASKKKKTTKKKVGA